MQLDISLVSVPNLLSLESSNSKPNIERTNSDTKTPAQNDVDRILLNFHQGRSRVVDEYLMLTASS
jgi:hypothetical protein